MYCVKHCLTNPLCGTPTLHVLSLAAVPSSAAVLQPSNIFLLPWIQCLGKTNLIDFLLKYFPVLSCN